MLYVEEALGEETKALCQIKLKAFETPAAGIMMNSHFRRLPIRQKSGEVVITELRAANKV